MSKILVVAAHPDDEILGIGAAIAKHVEAGDSAYALILGEGQTSRFGNREDAPAEILEKLHKDTMEAAAEIGFLDVSFRDFPDNRFDSVDMLEIVKSVEKQIAHIKPDIIYTHHHGDLNVDHQKTFEAVLTATRPIGDYCVKEIYAFETLSSTEWNFKYRESAFCPNVFIDVTKTFEKKLHAMSKYRSELCEFPHPRSLKGLEASAKKWGSVIGVEYAEAFELIRKVQ